MLLGLAVLLFSSPAIPQAAQAPARRAAPVVLAAATEAHESAANPPVNSPAPPANAISPGTQPLTGISLMTRPDLAMVPDLSASRVPLAPGSFPAFTYDVPSSLYGERSRTIVPAALSNSNAAPPFDVAKVSPPVAPMRSIGARLPMTWWALAAASHSAAAFDAWTTRQAIGHGKGRELDPFLKPFAGNASLYVAIQVSPAVIDYVGKRMLTSQHAWMRKTWWVPQLTGTAVSALCGIHNLDVLHRPGFPR